MKFTKFSNLSKTILLFWTFIFAINSCSDNATDPKDKTYIASGHPEWAPIMFQDNDKIVGAGPEIVTNLLNELGFKVEVKYEGAWDEVQTKAKTGEVDLLVAAYKTAERETYMSYSIPYTIDPVSIFVTSGSTVTFDKWSDLVGKRGIVTKGDSYGQEFDVYLKDNLTVTVANSPDEAFNMLTNGQGDYFVYALYSGERAIKTKKLGNQVKILPKYVSSENFYLTVSKKSALVDYLPKINQILNKYITEGKIDSIIQKYR